MNNPLIEKIINLIDKYVATYEPDIEIKRYADAALHLVHANTSSIEITFKEVVPLAQEVLIAALARQLYYEDALEPLVWGTSHKIQSGMSQFKEHWQLWENANEVTREQYMKKARLLFKSLDKGIVQP